MSSRWYELVLHHLRSVLLNTRRWNCYLTYLVAKKFFELAWCIVLCLSKYHWMAVRRGKAHPKWSGYKLPNGQYISSVIAHQITFHVNSFVLFFHMYPLKPRPYISPNIEISWPAVQTVTSVCVRLCSLAVPSCFSDCANVLLSPHPHTCAHTCLEQSLLQWLCHWSVHLCKSSVKTS